MLIGAAISLYDPDDGPGRRIAWQRTALSSPNRADQSVALNLQHIAKNSAIPKRSEMIDRQSSFAWMYPIAKPSPYG